MRLWIALLVLLIAVLTACSGSGGSPLEPTRSSTVSSGSSGLTSTDVTFTADDTKTYGTLEVPAHRDGRRLAAALLIPGSGPTDRDGNDAKLGVTPGTLKVLADGLARQGIATLRFDKYFTGRTGAGRFATDPTTTSIDNDLRQAQDAYAYLARQPVVDTSKLLVVGHSEGGMIALSVATAAAVKPAGLALLEPQDLRILDLVRIQLLEAVAALRARGTLTDAQARSNTALVVRAVAAFRAGSTPSLTGMTPALAQLAGQTLGPGAAHYVRSWDAVVPATLAGRLRSGTRMLVTEGTKDTNVPPRTITALIRALRASGSTGPGLVLIQGADHDLHLADQPANDAVLAPKAIVAIEGWAQPFAA